MAVRAAVEAGSRYIAKFILEMVNLDLTGLPTYEVLLHCSHNVLVATFEQ